MSLPSTFSFGSDRPAIVRYRRRAACALALIGEIPIGPETR
jgi:hypothetical protein